jgi:hypothetical protein
MVPSESSQKIKNERVQAYPVPEEHIPPVDENDLRAAALIYLIETSARKKPLLIVSGACVTLGYLQLFQVIDDLFSNAFVASLPSLISITFLSASTNCW